jgi:hypothetical protein
MPIISCVSVRARPHIGVECQFNVRSCSLCRWLHRDKSHQYLVHLPPFFIMFAKNKRSNSIPVTLIFLRRISSTYGVRMTSFFFLCLILSLPTELNLCSWILDFGYLFLVYLLCLNAKGLECLLFHVFLFVRTHIGVDFLFNVCSYSLHSQLYRSKLHQDPIHLPPIFAQFDKTKSSNMIPITLIHPRTISCMYEVWMTAFLFLHLDNITTYLTEPVLMNFGFSIFILSLLAIVSERNAWND